MTHWQRWNTPANRRRAAWAFLALPVWLLTCGLAIGATFGVGGLLYELGAWADPVPLWVLSPFQEIVVLCFAGWVCLPGTLVGLALGGWREWSAPPSVGAAAGPGFLGAAALYAAGPDRGGVVMSLALAHLGLFCGMAGGLLALLRARLERPLDNAAAVADDDA